MVELLVVDQQREVVVQLVVVLKLPVIGLVIVQQPEVIVLVVALQLRVDDRWAVRFEVLLILLDRRVVLKNHWEAG